MGYPRSLVVTRTQEAAVQPPIRSREYSRTARTRHPAACVPERTPAAACGVRASRMHSARSTQLGMRKPSPHNAWRRLRLGRKSRARIWARADHPSTQELQNMDAPTAGRYRCTTCAGVRWQGRVPFAPRASLPPCGRWTYEVGCEA